MPLYGQTLVSVKFKKAKIQPADSIVGLSSVITSGKLPFPDVTLILGIIQVVSI
jgi:hypothetical protein